jgi:hypothetical protein
MPETAANTGRDCTDLTTMEDPGVEVEIESGALERLREGQAGRLTGGVRMIFRAALFAERHAGDEPRVAVETAEAGRIGFLPYAVVRRYGPVLKELQRAGRVGVCAGYLQRGAGGGLGARLLLHEPYECLRRIETDVLDSLARHRQADSA